ncbi:hypothetical protein CHS0354_004428 [Potamilus streckersoni]|uniref:Uncharacterized protein n=1 Tax=Potamilus streckersoni TaxID=2493646 RepID=A0AAE0TBG5_9BIVA|nr:hypothetical protein CHS0354_004428 [Potamilus streckersoni]
MSGRKRSGAQCRKRKEEAEKASKMSSTLLASFLKKAKKKEAEAAAKSNSSESEDDGYQPPISEHVDDNVEKVEDSEKNMIKTDVAVYAEKTPKIQKTRMSSLNRSNIMMNLLTVTGKMRHKNFLIEKLKLLIMMWFLLY